MEIGIKNGQKGKLKNEIYFFSFVWIIDQNIICDLNRCKRTIFHPSIGEHRYLDQTDDDNEEWKTKILIFIKVSTKGALSFMFRNGDFGNIFHNKLYNRIYGQEMSNHDLDQGAITNTYVHFRMLM